MTMNNQFGPPLRFKAVNVKTGDSINIGSLDMLPMFKLESLTSVHVCTDQFDITSGYGTRDFILTQSTGLHDSRGVEIFWGDVGLLKCTCATGLFYVDFYDDQIVVTDLYTDEYLSVRHSHLSKFDAIIGNRWMSHEELEKRAGELLSE